MSTTLKIKNLAIIIDEIEESHKSSLLQYALDTGIVGCEFFVAADKNSGRELLLEKFKKLLMGKKEISAEQIQKLETEFDLIIKVGTNSLDDTVIVGSSYAEIYFVDIAAQDFDQGQLARAIEDFARRKRNFGI